MSAEDERQYARSLIARALAAHARVELEAGRIPPTPEEEEDLAPAAGPQGAGRAHPAGGAAEGVPLRPRRQRDDGPRARRVPAGGRARAEEPHDRRLDERGEDPAAAGGGQRDPAARAAGHRGAG